MAGSPADEVLLEAVQLRHQRTLDLCDPSAIDECERQIEALRRKIKRLQL